MSQLSPSEAAVQESISSQDKFIASTFKLLAKAFIRAVDIDKLKQSSVDRIDKMTEAKFQKQYTRVYLTVGRIEFLRKHYGISKDMTKAKVKEKIKLLDKSKIYAIIDAVPDEIIVEQFRQFLSETKDNAEKTSIAEEIHRFWDKMQVKIRGN